MTSCPHAASRPVDDEPVPLFLPLLRDRFDPDAELGLVRATRRVARLDVPDEHRVELERRSVQRFDVLGSMEDSLAAVHASVDYLTDLVGRYRVRPRPGLLGNLLHCHGDDLSDRELAELADGLLTGGHET